jgi:hypothetical protein
MKIGTCVQVVLTLSQKSERLQWWYYWWEGVMMLWCMPLWWLHVAWYTSSYMKIGTCVQAIFSFYLSNLNGCNIGITDGRINEVRRWNGLRWNDICTKFHDNQFRYLNNIMFISATIWVVVILVLPFKGVYEVHHWDELRRHDIHTKFHKDWFKHSKANRGVHIQPHTHMKKIS